MSELINGDGTIPKATSGWVQHVIASSTNASPIAVTFCSPHCANEGDTIEVEGHLVNTAANGGWRVHVTGTTTLQLLGSTGNGVGGNTGYAIDYSVNPLIQVGDDLELASASAFDTPYEGLFNFVPYLYKRAGKYALYDQQIIASAGGTLASYPNSWVSQSIASGTWVVLTGTETVYPNVVGLNDFLEVEIDCGLATGLTASMVWGVAIGFSINGGSWQIGGSFDGTNVPEIGLAGNGSSDYRVHAKYTGPVKLSALPISAGGLSIAVFGFQNHGSPLTIQLYQPYQIKVTHYRSNA
jgi:hypothetical protein